MPEPVPAVPEAVGAQTSTSGLAIASLITAFLVPIVPVILGHLAKKEIRRSSGTKTGNGIATAGLVLGYLGIAGLLIWIVLIAGLVASNTTGLATTSNTESNGNSSIPSNSINANGIDSATCQEINRKVQAWVTWATPIGPSTYVSGSLEGITFVDQWNTWISGYPAYATTFQATESALSNFEQVKADPTQNDAAAAQLIQAAQAMGSLCP